MEVRISLSAKNFIIAQPEAGRLLLEQAMDALEVNPNIGTSMPFPWRPDALAFGQDRYWITYSISEDNVLHVCSVSVVPDLPVT